MNYFSETTKWRRPSVIIRTRILTRRSSNIPKLSEPIVELTNQLESTKEELAEAQAKIQLMQAELEKTQEFSFIDSLTGCYNRNYFNKYKSDHFDKNRDHNRIGIVLADVNDLKKINDRHGHNAGDELIKKSAETLRGIFRKDDIVVRLGGDEFVVICTNFNHSSDFAQELTKSVSEKISKSRVSLAFGVAVFNSETDNTLCDTVARADELMYQNKKSYKEYLAGINLVAKRRDLTKGSCLSTMNIR